MECSKLIFRFFILITILKISYGDISTTINLISLDTESCISTTGTECSLSVFICVRPSNSSYQSCYSNVTNTYQLQTDGSTLTTNDNSFNFSNNAQYGSWSNPQMLTIATDDDQEFEFYWLIYDGAASWVANAAKIVDQFGVKVDTNNYDITSFTHNHQKIATTVQFSLINPFATTTPAPTTTAKATTTTTASGGTTAFPGCQNGGTVSEDGKSCICPDHYNGTYCQNIVCDHGGTSEGGNTCSCSPDFTGQYCETTLYRDCNQIYQDDKTAGVKTVYIKGDNTPLSVYCNSGWLTVQERVDNSLSFDKTMADYENGFGSLPSDNVNMSFNYWLGLKHLSYFTKADDVQIQFLMKYCGGHSLFYSTYKHVLVGDAESQYKFTASEYDSSSTGGDGVQWFNENSFYTPTGSGDGNACATSYGNSGFWFNPSYCVGTYFLVPNFSGVYPDSTQCNSTENDADGILWTPLTGNTRPNHPTLGTTQIRIKPSNA